MKKINKLLVAFLAAFLLFSTANVAVETITNEPQIVEASATTKREKGTDWAKYQGNYGKFGYASDKFSFAQIGGYQGGYYNQSTYNTQVQSGIAQGKRMHTYIWFQVGGNATLAKQVVDHFAPQIQTPKGSIVALDYEAGASTSIKANTDAMLVGMREVRAKGYVPMLYTYKPYMLAHIDYKRILKNFPDSFWIAAYMNYKVMSNPNYNYFPSLPGISIWQFTSTYIAGGLDGNVDLTGITYKGYSKNDNPKGPDTPAIDNGKGADDTHKYEIKVGYTVKVNFSAKQWATGQSIPRSVKGRSFKVQQVSGKKVLLSGILSWINRSDVEILDTNSTPQIKVDGYWGRDVTKSLQRVFGQYQDGVVSSQIRSNNLTSFTHGYRGSLLIRSIQSRLGVHVDGILGATTIKALQKHYGTTIDGVISPQSKMIMAMQQALNSNKF